MENHRGTKNNWVGIRSILSQAIQNINTDPNQTLNRLSFYWNLVVGRDIAAISQVKRISGKTLFVRLAEGGWSSALESLKGKIIRKLNGLSGKEAITRLNFEEGPINKSYNSSSSSSCVLLPETSKSNKKTPPTKLEWEGSLEMLKDQDLKEILIRITKKMTNVAVILSGILFISNCGTLTATGGPNAVDLSSSFAVKGMPMEAKRVSQTRPRDPKTYYHYLLALKAEQSFQFQESAGHYEKVIKYDPYEEGSQEKLVKFYLRAGNIDEVVKASKAALGFFPKNLAINMILADVLSGRGDYDEALSLYEKVSEIDPGGSRSYLMRGTVYGKMQEYDRARELYTEVVMVENTNPLGHFYLGRAYLRNGELGEAEKSLKNSVALRPNFFEARKHLAWVFESLGNKDEAIKEYKFLLKLKPGKKWIRKKLARLSNGNPSDPVNSISSGIPKELEEQTGVHMKIARVYFEQALYLRALDEFQLVLVHKDSKTPRILLARIYEILGRLDKAVEQFEVLRGREPESVEMLLYAARLYSLNNQTKMAIELLNQAIQIKPGNNKLYHSLALAYSTVQNNELAIENMRHAITLEPDKSSYYFELGALLEKGGEYEDAIASLQRAVEINPRHSNAHNFLGYMYALKGRYLDRAIEHLEKALAIQPRNGYFLDSLGWIYYKKGDHERALAEIKKAMIYTSPDPVLYDHLGDIHFSLKNYSEASGAWRTSLSLTKRKKDDFNGEVPDQKGLKEKIDRAYKLINE